MCFVDGAGDGAFTDTTFAQNVGSYGGAIWSFGFRSLFLVRVNFLGNLADGDGGALYVSQPGGFRGVSVQIVDCNFSGNAASGNGGGMSVGNSNNYIDGVTVAVIRSSFVANVAKTTGGAVFVDGSLRMSQTRLESNRAGGDGGALYLNGRMSSFQNTIHWATDSSSFFNNTAGGYGGAASFSFSASYSATAVMLINSSFSTNTAQASGGAVYLSNGGQIRMLVQTCAFSGNSVRAPGAIVGTDIGTDSSATYYTDALTTTVDPRNSPCMTFSCAVAYTTTTPCMNPRSASYSGILASASACGLGTAFSTNVPQMSDVNWQAGQCGDLCDPLAFRTALSACGTQCPPPPSSPPPSPPHPPPSPSPPPPPSPPPKASSGDAAAMSAINSSW